MLSPEDQKSIYEKEILDHINELGLEENKLYRFSEAALAAGLLPNRYNCYEILNLFQQARVAKVADVWFPYEVKAFGRWENGSGEFAYKLRD